MRSACACAALGPAAAPGRSRSADLCSLCPRSQSAETALPHDWPHQPVFTKHLVCADGNTTDKKQARINHQREKPILTYSSLKIKVNMGSKVRFPGESRQDPKKPQQTHGMEFTALEAGISRGSGNTESIEMVCKIHTSVTYNASCTDHKPLQGK
ncbi:hypothetical protein MG293_006063, partial [Ovis ammon polii]